MLSPDDWREFLWGASSYPAGFGNIYLQFARLWRVQANGGAAGGTLAFGTAGGPLDAGLPVVTLAANQTITLEPNGMQLVDVVGTGDVAITLEYIYKPT